MNYGARDLDDLLDDLRPKRRITTLVIRFDLMLGRDCFR